MRESFVLLKSLLQETWQYSKLQGSFGPNTSSSWMFPLKIHSCYLNLLLVYFAKCRWRIETKKSGKGDLRYFLRLKQPSK